MESLFTAAFDVHRETSRYCFLVCLEYLDGWSFVSLAVVVFGEWCVLGADEYTPNKRAGIDSYCMVRLGLLVAVASRRVNSWVWRDR